MFVTFSYDLGYGTCVQLVAIFLGSQYINGHNSKIFFLLIIIMIFPSCKMDTIVLDWIWQPFFLI